MLEAVSVHSSVAIYEQIENQIRFAIASGKLTANDRLPSIKELGDRLGINFNTVAKAYRDLEVMGLIYTRRGMGCFVNKDVRKRCVGDCRIQITKRIHEISQEAKAAGIPKKALALIVGTCFQADDPPYTSPPSSLLALARKK